MTPFTSTAIVLALKKMFSESHFSICTIDTLIQTTGVLVPREIYSGWRLLHCVNYADMSPVMRSELMRQVVETFKQPPGFDLNQLHQINGYTLLPENTAPQAIEVTVPPPKRKLFGLLN